MINKWHISKHSIRHKYNEGITAKDLSDRWSQVGGT